MKFKYVVTQKSYWFQYGEHGTMCGLLNFGGNFMGSLRADAVVMEAL